MKKPNTIFGATIYGNNDRIVDSCFSKKKQVVSYMLGLHKDKRYKAEAYIKYKDGSKNESIVMPIKDTLEWYKVFSSKDELEFINSYIENNGSTYGKSI